MDEVRSPKLGVRAHSADRIGAARLSTGRPFGRRAAINPLVINLGVVGAVLAIAIGITLYIWDGVGDTLPAGGAPAASAEVQEIEQLLGDLSFTPGKIDGVMDDETSEAIRAFQQAAGLPEDGLPSAGLLEELKAVAGQ